MNIYPYSVVKQITPALAQQFLANNHANQRRIIESRVAYYAKLMTAGKFIVTGDSISFDDQGNLVNGQHRLLAIVRSGTTQWCNVIYDLPPNAIYEAIDQGKTRTTNDILKMRGDIPDQSAVSGTIAAIYRFDSGKLNTKGIRGNLTIPELTDFYDANKEAIIEAIHIGKQIGKNTTRILNGTALPAALYYIVRRVNTRAVEFFFHLASGANLDIDHPALILRQIFSTDMAAKTHYTTPYRYAFTIRAFNHFATGRKTSRNSIIRWKKEEQEMPEIISNIHSEPHQFFQK